MSDYLKDLFIDEAKKALESRDAGEEIINQDKTITENGTYTADEGYTGLGTVNVSVVPTGDGYDVLDSVINGAIEGNLSSNVVSICKYGLYGRQYLQVASFPNLRNAYDSAFQDCTSLSEIYAPNLEYITTNTFNNTGLISVNFPKLQIASSNSMYGNKKLISVTLPKVPNIEQSMFHNCIALTTVDVSSAKSIKYYGLADTSVIKLILRNSTLTSLASLYALKNTPIESGTGYIYVPSALIEEYKAATNWSTFAAQFRSLEDYTVDGTVTGELDESKI